MFSSACLQIQKTLPITGNSTSKSHCMSCRNSCSWGHKCTSHLRRQRANSPTASACPQLRVTLSHGRLTACQFQSRGISVLYLIPRHPTWMCPSSKVFWKNILPNSVPSTHISTLLVSIVTIMKDTLIFRSLEQKGIVTTQLPN